MADDLDKDIDAIPTIHARVDEEGHIEYGDGTDDAIREIVERIAGFSPDDDSPEAREAQYRAARAARDALLGERRVVEATFAGEDFRAFIGRCLLFVDTDPKHGASPLASIHITISPSWVTACAADGYVMGIQKIRCESESGGQFLLHRRDAKRMLAMLPKPSKDLPMEDVEIDFVTGSGDALSRLLNMRYEEPDGTVISYSCRGTHPAAYPDYRQLVTQNAAEPEQPVSHFSVRPEYMALIAKAESAAKDQYPEAVRWYITNHGGIVATFSSSEEHDHFLAFLMPLLVDFAASDSLRYRAARVFTTAEDSERVRTPQESML